MKPFITPETSKGGKKILPFQCEGVDSSEIAKLLLGHDLRGFTMPKSHSFSASWAFNIFFGESQIQFSSACTQIGGWQEVGSLNIKVEAKRETGQLEVEQVDFAVSRITKVERMVFEDDDVISFCGLAITTENGEELVIAAGIPPGSVSVRASFLKSQFEPQFEQAICRMEKVV